MSILTLIHKSTITNQLSRILEEHEDQEVVIELLQKFIHNTPYFSRVKHDALYWAKAYYKYYKDNDVLLSVAEFQEITGKKYG